MCYGRGSVALWKKQLKSKMNASFQKKKIGDLTDAFSLNKQLYVWCNWRIKKNYISEYFLVSSLNRDIFMEVHTILSNQ